MDLREIKKQTTWNEATESLNDNFATIEIEVEKVKNSTIRNKGYYASYDALVATHPMSIAGTRAFVGVTSPFAVYIWDSTQDDWVDSGETIVDEAVDLGNYYTKDEVDSEISGEITSLLSMGALYLGKATYDDEPADIKTKGFYIATDRGEYTHFIDSNGEYPTISGNNPKTMILVNYQLDGQWYWTSHRWNVLNPNHIAHETGTSGTLVMSQKATTDAIAAAIETSEDSLQNKADLENGYVPDSQLPTSVKDIVAFDGFISTTNYLQQSANCSVGDDGVKLYFNRNNGKFMVAYNGSYYASWINTDYCGTSGINGVTPYTNKIYISRNDEVYFYNKSVLVMLHNSLMHVVLSQTEYNEMVDVGDIEDGVFYYTYEEE